jgi:hypothetical protein
VLKWVIETIFINSSPFALLIINVKILSNFQKECCTFGRKKDVWKKKGLSIFRVLSVLNMQTHFWFVSNFHNVNFTINKKYSQKNYDNLNYYASFVIFQTYKNAILRNVHSFGWFLWLWFCPMALLELLVFQTIQVLLIDFSWLMNMYILTKG